jgi:hypothetical protein
MLNAKEKMGLDSDFIQPHSATGDISTVLQQLEAMKQRGTLTDEEFQEMKTKLLAKM